MNIVLIGYRGSGKSAVGKKLAARLQRGFVDTDDLIEERHRTSINEIVKSEGWDRFRGMEKKIIEEITREDHLVIAVGGGAVLDADNVKVLRRNGFMIWLKADSRILLKRIGTDPLTIGKRPSLTGKGSLEEIEEVLTFRNPYYEEASEIQLDTSGLDVDAVVERILSFVSLSPSGRGRERGEN
jgi:shikimate kinase